MRYNFTSYKVNQFSVSGEESNDVNPTLFLKKNAPTMENSTIGSYKFLLTNI